MLRIPLLSVSLAVLVGCGPVSNPEVAFSVKNEYAESIFSLDVSVDGHETWSRLFDSVRLQYEETSEKKTLEGDSSRPVSVIVEGTSIGQTHSFGPDDFEITGSMPDLVATYDFDLALGEFSLRYSVNDMK